MERKVVEFENLAECANCGTQGAFDLGTTYLCAECLAGPEDAEAVREERDFLRDENARLQRIVNTRDNKIKHLKEQLSDSKLRHRIRNLEENIKQLSQRNAELKREKVALHEYMDHKQYQEEKLRRRNED